MADENKEKSEEPTNKRLTDERDKGNVGSTREMATLVMFVGALLYLMFVAPYSAKEVTRILKDFFENTHDIPPPSQALFTYIFDRVYAISFHVLPFMLVMFVGSILSFTWQIGLLWSWKVFERAGFNKINPVTGIKRIFSLTQLIEMGKGFFKIFAFSLITILLFVGFSTDFINMPILLLPAQFDHMLLYILLVFVAAVITMIPIAIIDYIYQTWNHKRQLRMSPDEVKRERKDEDGDPEIKGKIRQIRLQRMKAMMAKAVQESDVIITNPTHYSIGLLYDEAKHAAPIVTSKGVDEIALHMRRIAEDYNVPIVENPPLARSLYATVEINEEVKPDQWQAVAEVIRYVYSLRNRG